MFTSSTTLARQRLAGRAEERAAQLHERPRAEVLDEGDCRVDARAVTPRAARPPLFTLGIGAIFPLGIGAIARVGGRGELRREAREEGVERPERRAQRGRFFGVWGLGFGLVF